MTAKNSQKVVLKDLSQQQIEELVRSNKHIYTEHYDQEFLIEVIENVLQHIDETYFRSVFIGFRDLPERNNPDRPLIFASNHSGMAFPWDAIIFAGGILKKHGYDFRKSVRVLIAPMLSQTKLMNPYLMRDVWKRCGGVDATALNFETMMEYPDAELLIYPEGVPGIGKGFNHKYELQPFSTSFVRMSLKYKTDIIPYGTINGEYINPYVFSSKPLNRIVQKVGIPFLPLGLITPLILLQPWIFYMAFPAKLFFVMGERIKPYELIDKPYDEVTREDLQELTGKVKDEMQRQINEAVEKWGQDPFQMKEFWKRLKKNIKKFPYNLPFGWPMIFSEFERQYNRKEKTGKPVNVDIGRFSFFKMLLRNPLVICYFIPLIGWIPLLIKGYMHNRLNS